MAIETTLLLVLIVALIIGNALLYFFKPKKTSEIKQIVQASNSLDEKIFFTPDAPSNEVLLLKSNFKALNEKLNMAHSRMNDLESFSRKEIRELKIAVAELQKQKETIKVWKSSPKK
ncbi:MAG: hypothetical protein Q7S21_07840 [archaeon]|nr:hypothetical protein [archaeon]